MAQFSCTGIPTRIARLPNPFLLDVQSDLIADLGSRVVVPLCPTSAMQGKPITTLMPVFVIEECPVPC